MENAPQNNQIKINSTEIYFQSIRFNQVRGSQGQIKLEIKHAFEIGKSNDKKNIKLTMTTMISSNDMRIDMEMKSVIVIGVEDNTQVPPQTPQLMVNILYPYVRSQVSLVTTQPGIMPIMLPIQPPVINVVDSKAEDVITA